MKHPVYLSAPGLINALGVGTGTVTRRLFAGDTTGMVASGDWLAGGEACVGRAPLAADTAWHAGIESVHHTRNNQLLLAAAAQILPAIEAACARHGRHRVGVVIGTSTSGIAEGEAAVAQASRGGGLPPQYHYAQQELGAPSLFLARQFRLGGPVYTVSTACTSGAKAFASARNLLRHGLCDAVLVGGADSLSRLTVNGFAALESLSPALCNPMSRNRAGINIGEGAALFMLSNDATDTVLSGVGESSDAWHVSAPDPKGLGAQAAMRAALADAQLLPSDIGYINLHATATPKNDEMESLAVAQVFGSHTPASGTKPLTGHMLGTAGATEIAFCWLALRHERLPPHVWDGQADPALPSLALVRPGTSATGLRHCLSNSFAFGGNNASLLLSRA